MLIRLADNGSVPVGSAPRVGSRPSETLTFHTSNQALFSAGGDGEHYYGLGQSIVSTQTTLTQCHKQEK